MTLPEGWEVVPTYDAKCLVAYLMSLDQSHPLERSESDRRGVFTAPAPSLRRPQQPAPAKEAK